MIDENFVTSQIQKFLAHKQKLPFRPAWSRYALSQYLKREGLLGSQRATISEWEREILYYVKDFRNHISKDTPTDKDGKPLTIYPLSPYQAATIVRLSYALTHLRPYLQGCKYTYLIQGLIKNRDIQRKYFSYAVWQYDQQDVA